MDAYGGNSMTTGAPSGWSDLAGLARSEATSRPAALPVWRLIGLTLALAIAYGGLGLLGLQLAVPPGYATLIWPASGMAVAALLIFSPRLAPGVFLGSLAVNAYIGGVLEGGSLDGRALALAVAIASGSTLQALAGACAARRLFGIPTILKSPREVAVFAGLVGPLAGLIAATVGTGALYASDLVTAEQVAGNWLTWWLGDVIGILVVLPLALLGPWRRWGAGWSRGNAASLRAMSIAALMVPLGLTFYGWKWTSMVAYERGELAFAALADEGERALLHRLSSYVQGLDGAVGLFHASSEVSAADWRAYVEALDIGRTLPGIFGMGVIDDVAHGDLAAYTAGLRALGVEEFVVDPGHGARAHHFIIRFIEPLAANRPALGLDIAYESHRREAAEMARLSGQPTITRRIFLVQDDRLRAGFLLLRPLYAEAVPIDTVEQRLAAFTGWVYAPFVGSRFMAGLTASQDSTLEIAVYDGAQVDADQQIFSSRSADEAAGRSTYTVAKTMPVLGQTWTLVWTSTDQFDGTIKNNEALFVLLAGLLVSALFAGFLLSHARREQTIQRMVVQKTREIVAREDENRAVVNTAVVGILLLDEQGRVLSANEAALDIFDVQPEDVPQMSIKDLIQTGPGLTGAEILGAFRSTRSAPTKPVSGRSRSGQPLDLEFQLNPWITVEGQHRYTAIVRDVTRQRQVAVALEEAELRWSSALRGASIGVFDVNLASGTSIVSDTWREMLGLAGDGVVDPQWEWRRRVHPEDLLLVDAADAACLAGWTERSESEYRIRHAGGHWIWLRSEASVTQRDPAGRALRLVGTQTDITALKEAEAALRSSEERLRSAIEHAPIGMALVDPAGAWINVNEALLTFLGYAADEFLQLDFRDLDHPDDAGLDKDLIAQLVAGDISHYQLEKRYLHRGGHAVWGLLNVSAARGADGGVDYFIAQIQDIQHRKEMDRLKSEFISNVSHELRTPLTSIRGSLGLVMGAMAEQIPPGVLRLLGIAHKNSERLILLINDILDLEKMSSEKLQFTVGPHRLRPEVLLAMDINHAYAAQFDVGLVLDETGYDPECAYDSARLQQVLSNLLSNAAKFSPRGGTVHLSIKRFGAMARVSIADSGPGIPAGFRGQIFSAFSQADASATRETGGTGLGLHISKQMMEKMSGNLDYSSVEGRGSTFWIDVPLTAATAMAAPARVLARPSPLPHLLHVEDDEDFRAFIATALEGQVTVAHAGTLNAARSALARERFDLILLDLRLADGNGLDLLDDVSLQHAGQVIVLTATESVVVDHRVSAALVKSRTPESVIVETILAAIRPAASVRRRGAKR